MRGGLTGFIVSAVVHLGLLASVVYGLASQPGRAPQERPVPLKLAFFQPAPAPVAVAKPSQPSPPQPVAPPEQQVETIPETPPPPPVQPPKVRTEPKPQPSPTPAPKVVRKKADTPKKEIKKVVEKKSVKPRPPEPLTEILPPKEIVQPATEAVQPPVTQAPSPAVATAVPPSAPSQPSRQQVEAETQYKTQLRNLIAKTRKYPAKAKRKGEEGTADVSFTIYPDGHIESIQIMQSSGSRTLDASATKAIQKISKKLPFPPEIRRTSWQLTVPLVYRLR